MNNSINIKNNQINNNIVQSKNNQKQKNDLTSERPSTAPQKEDKDKIVQNNTLKRLPSPNIKSIIILIK